MLRIATVSAYDALDAVVVTAHVRQYGDVPEEPSSIVFECTTSLPGTGESDPRQWLVDALVGLLEAT